MAANCDITIGILGDSDKAKTVLANKVVNGVLYKTPVLTAKSSGVRLYFYGVDDIFICNNTPDDIARSILEIVKILLSTLQKRIENFYRKWLSNFSNEAVFKRFDEVLNG